MNLAPLLLRRAQESPDRVAIWFGATPWATYGQWAQRSLALANAMVAEGLAVGDRVLLFMRNHPRYLELFWAVWLAGAVAVPVNAKLHRREVEWIIDNAGITRGFVTADVAPAPLAGLQRQVDIESDAFAAMLSTAAALPLTACADRQSDDLAWLFYTSGTTGRPKGVMLSHRNLLTMGLTYFIDVEAIRPTDRMVYAAPLSHGAGLYAIPHMMAGAAHVVPVSGGVDPAELFNLGWTLGALTTFAAPTIVKRLVEHADSFQLTQADCARAFKTIVYGGAPMYLADIQRALAIMGPRFVQIYGQGETPMVGTALSRATLSDLIHPRALHRLASVGVAQTPVEIRIADVAGQTQAVGVVGEVLIRGDTVMTGYWRDPAATAAAIQDGWLWTGDIGHLDDDGYLTLMDRSKDLIISGGANIYPREVEEVLLTAAGVAEVAVVGAPDAEWGEAVVAFVVCHSGQTVDPAALEAHCLTQLARFKRPKQWFFLPALPKNNYGKVLKTELRARLLRSSNP
jgi:long-chain acyl-CoA synthetase